MKYFVKGANDKEYEIELTELPDGNIELVLDGETSLVDVDEIKQGHLYSLLIGNSSHDVTANRKNGNWEVTMEGRLFTFGVQDETAKALEKAGGQRVKPKGPPIVKAEMPGVVVEVKVNPGDSVEAGDILLVMEAMKMQNEILAPAKATVGKVSVSASQQLSDGDEMVHLIYLDE